MKYRLAVAALGLIVMAFGYPFCPSFFGRIMVVLGALVLLQAIPFTEMGRWLWKKVQDGS